MPPLAERLKTQSLPGYAAAENPSVTAPPILPGAALPGNKYIRCPLPPFSANSDTLRQYNEGGAVPTRRVIPIPNNNGLGSGTQIINTSVTTSGGGSSGGSSGTTLKAVTAFLSVPSIAPLGTYQTVLPMAKSFQLLQLVSNTALEVRMYGNLLAQVSDIARLTDYAPPFETNGIITDVVFDTSPYQWNWQNRIGANADNPQGLNIYITAVNPSPTTGTSLATIAFTFLPLES